ncbi:glycoside hydrolase [Wilcoxina mikolae CBS 423.85]|nr:glycoside hydrolase [Wilcoxina mikolae CBS 423.85]
MKHKLSNALGLLCLVSVAAAQKNNYSTASPAPSPTSLTLQISTKSGVRNKTTPLLHGLFFEDINHSGDGGLYAELTRNCAFQGSDVRFGNMPGMEGDRIISSENKAVPWGPTLTAWKLIGGVVLSLDVLNPLSNALQTVLTVDIPTNATGEVGFLNEGWWGMDVKPQPYDASFYIKPSGPLYNKNISGLTVSLAITDDVFASERIIFDEPLSTTKYTAFNSILTPTRSATNSNNTFAITFNASEAAGNTFFFNLISVFPPTYKGRKNGLQKGLAEHLAALKLKFLRFPGGNNMEGMSIDARWQWKKTIGPLIDRPGRPGDWSYYNTDGLGYLEYLMWCEDMEIKPLLTVYAGYSLDPANRHPTNTLEYAMGGPDIYWGALRAEHGHPKSFNIKYVGIGNEDWFSDSYYWKFPMFLEALQKAYPDITYIASQATETSVANRNTTIPSGTMWDLCYKGVQIFVGEYSVLGRDQPGGVDWVNGTGRFSYRKSPSLSPPAILKLVAATMVAAIGEAISESERGSEVLTGHKGDFNPVWWHASVSEEGKIWVKLVNAATTLVPVTLKFDTTISSVNGTVLGHEDEYGFNYIGNATAISPRTFMLDGRNVRKNKGRTVEWDVPGLSIVVLEVR